MEELTSDVPATPADSMYGVRSLQSTQELGEVAESLADIASVYDIDENAPLVPRIWHGPSRDTGNVFDHVNYGDGSAETSPSQLPRGHLEATRLTGPLTSFYLRSPITGTSHASSSLPSTPNSISVRSLQLSDDDVPSDEERVSVEYASSEEGFNARQVQSEEAAPQLVMPSISMPSRRPFTERGKKLGKLKIVVAGAQGKLLASVFGGRQAY